MRVLVVTPWLPTQLKPAAGLFTQRDIELLSRDHQVTVLHLAHPRDLPAGTGTPDQAGIVRVPHNFLSPASVRRATRTVRELISEHDLVHSMAMSALLPVAAARPQIPWVHTEHFSELVNPQLPWTRKALLRGLSHLYRFPTETVAVGRELGRVIDRYRSVPSTVIGNFVRFPAEPPSERPPQASGGGPNLLAVGGLISRKGPLESVRAVAELHDKGVEATLTWVGTGPLREETLQLAARLAVADYVHLPGYVSPEDLSAYFLNADIFLLPTEAETFGVVFAEALAHGLPVVTTGVGGHLDFLPEAGARVAKTRAPADLAGAVVDLLDAPERLTASELHAFASTRFSEESRQNEYGRVYAQAAGTPTR